MGSLAPYSFFNPALEKTGLWHNMYDTPFVLKGFLGREELLAVRLDVFGLLVYDSDMNIIRHIKEVGHCANMHQLQYGGEQLLAVRRFREPDFIFYDSNFWMVDGPDLRGFDTPSSGHEFGVTKLIQAEKDGECYSFIETDENHVLVFDGGFNHLKTITNIDTWYEARDHESHDDVCQGISDISYFTLSGKDYLGITTTAGELYIYNGDYDPVKKLTYVIEEDASEWGETRIGMNVGFQPITLDDTEYLVLTGKLGILAFYDANFENEQRVEGVKGRSIKIPRDDRCDCLVLDQRMSWLY